MKRYAELWWQQVKMSLVSGAQYRFDFVLKGGMALFWTAVTLLPLVAVFQQRSHVGGWTFPEALVVVACFQFLKAVLEGAVTPSLTAVVEGVRTGAFDFVLLKPADAQFLVSTARFEPWRLVDMLGAAAIMIYAFHTMGRTPGLAQIGVAAVLIAVALVLLYSVWILVISASFWVVRIDNLAYLLNSLFDAGRWPVRIFPHALQMFFTFVFPLALMTTFPAEALLGKLAITTAAGAVVGGGLFAWCARQAWLRSIRAYTSASS